MAEIPPDDSDEEFLEFMKSAPATTRKSERKKPKTPAMSLLDKAMNNSVRYTQEKQALMELDKIKEERQTAQAQAVANDTARKNIDVDDDDTSDKEEAYEGSLLSGKNKQSYSTKVKNALESDQTVPLSSHSFIRDIPVKLYTDTKYAVNALLTILKKQKSLNAVHDATVKANDHKMLGMFLSRERLIKYVKRSHDRNSIDLSILNSLATCLLRIATSGGLVDDALCTGAASSLFGMQKLFDNLTINIPSWVDWIEYNRPKSSDEDEEGTSGENNRLPIAVVMSLNLCLKLKQINDATTDLDSEITSLLILRTDSSVQSLRTSIERHIEKLVLLKINSLEEGMTIESWHKSIAQKCRDESESIYTEMITDDQDSQFYSFYHTLATFVACSNNKEFQLFKLNLLLDSLQVLLECEAVIDVDKYDLKSCSQYLDDPKRFLELTESSLPWKAIAYACVALQVCTDADQVAKLASHDEWCLAIVGCSCMCLYNGVDLLTKQDTEGKLILLTSVLSQWLGLQSKLDKKLKPLAAQDCYQRAYHRLYTIKRLADSWKSRLDRMTGKSVANLEQRDIRSFASPGPVKSRVAATLESDAA